MSAGLLSEKDKNDKLIGVNYDYKIQEPRQLREMEYVENGAIYMFKPEIMLNDSNRFGGNIGMIPNKFWQSFEIDEDVGIDEPGFSVVIGQMALSGCERTGSGPYTYSCSYTASEEDEESENLGFHFSEHGLGIRPEP